MNNHISITDRILIVAVFASFATLLFLNSRVSASEDMPLVFALVAAAGIAIVMFLQKVKGR